MATYQEDLVDPADTSGEMVCTICTRVLLDPHSSPCGHCFCHFCITHWLRRSRCCPLCRAGTGAHDLVEDRELRAECDAVHVLCSRRCGWRGRRDEQGAHSLLCRSGRRGDVTLQISGPLGISFEVLDGALLVGALQEDGAAWRHNSVQHSCEAMQIRVNDQVAEVDGMRGEPALLAYLAKRPERKSITLRRPQELAVSIDKRGMRLGVDVSWSRPSGVLTVQGVVEGAVFEHNRSARSKEEQLQKHDRIIEVNGVNGVGRPDSVVSILAAAETCVIKFHRHKVFKCCEL